MMDIRQIEDRLIEAERIVLDMHEVRVGPAPLRAQQLPYVHSRADRNGWGKRPGEKDQLQKEDCDAHALHRREFWEQFEDELTPEDVYQAQSRTQQWVHLVDDEGERRALLAWAYAMAGGRPFNRWCRANHIAVMTGRRRKNRAVEKIVRQLASKPDLHDGNTEIRVLPDSGQIGEVSATIHDIASGSETSLNSWMADDAFQPFRVERIVFPSGGVLTEIPTDQSEFTWANKRNEHRRQMEAKRRKEVAKEAEREAKRQIAA